MRPYSVLLHNAVYITTNSLGILTSMLGLGFFIRNRRTERVAAPALANVPPAMNLLGRPDAS
jgi:hypothetical protein